MTGLTGPDADVFELEVVVAELDSEVVSDDDDVELTDEVVSDDESEVVSWDVVVPSDDMLPDEEASEEVLPAVVLSTDELSDDAVDEVADVVRLPTLVPTVGVPAVSLLPQPVAPSTRIAATTATHGRTGRVMEHFINCPSFGSRPTDPGLHRR